MPIGPSTAQTPYLIGLEPNISFTSILSTGDQMGSGTIFGGIPDGIGAHDNGDGTVTLFVNHEFGDTSGTTRAHGATGAYIDQITVNKATLAVTDGHDAIQNVYLWNTTTDSYDLTPNVAFTRFCSGDLAQPSAFYNSATGNGSQELIYLTGEEGGQGRSIALFGSGAEAGNAYELAWMGNFPSENTLANPNTGDVTLLAAQQDGGTTGADSHVFFYIGQKASTGTELEKAGLTDGTLYVLKANGVVDEQSSTTASAYTTFSLQSLGDASTLDATSTNANAEAAGGTSFLRPEDGAWDPNNPGRYYFVTTNNVTSPSRLYALDFADVAHPELGGTITMLLDGSEGTGPEGVHRMFDNITVDAATGHVILQEDPGNNARVAQIWDYNPATDKLTDIAQHDPARFKTPTAPFTQDEESSGVVDVTSIFGDQHTHAYLLDVQAHYPAATDPNLAGVASTVVEGGQLLMMKVADPVLVGDNNANNLFGSAADETFTGKGGNDTILAGSGNDSIDAGNGADTIDAGAGSDTLLGGAGNDTLSGGDDSDVLNGGAGNDLLDGGNGADNLTGGLGTDVLTGGAGNDNLIGSDGADTLAGGLGADILTGGNQADTFLFTSASDSNNQSGVDVIKDFKHAQGDIIDLSGIDADTITSGDQAFTFTDAFHGVAGELYVSQIGKTLFYVQGDTNGDSNVDFVLQVTSPTALVAADFIL